MKVASNKILMLVFLVMADALAGIYLWFLLRGQVYAVPYDPKSGITESLPDPRDTMSGIDDNRRVPDAKIPAKAAERSPAGDVSSDASATGMGLGKLFILDRIFNDDGMLDRNETSLGDLIILDRLFGQGDASFDGQLARISDFLILNHLLGRTGSPILDGKDTLGNLFMTNRLFNK
jgi:hypothetical protein